MADTMTADELIDIAHGWTYILYANREHYEMAGRRYDRLILRRLREALA